MGELGIQIPLLKYSPGRVLYYKKNVIEIGDPQLVSDNYSSYDPQAFSHHEPIAFVQSPNGGHRIMME